MRVPRFSPWLLVATLAAAGAAAAAGYGLTAPKEYDATAQLLVLPISGVDTTFAGLGVLRDTNGKRAAAASAAVLVKAPEVAEAVRAQLGLRRSADSLLHAVRTRVVGESDIVDVTARDTSAVGAAQLANAFVDALIAQRTVTFQSQLATAIRRTQQLIATKPSTQERLELSGRLAVLRTYEGQPDPTLRRASSATTPTSAAWPDLVSLIFTGAGAGIAAGALALLALRLLRRGLPQYDRVVSSRSDDRAVEALVERLEQRLAARESALAARERDLKQRIDELRALDAGAPAASPDDSHLREREAALAERERQLEARVAAVTQRELAVARAAATRPQAARPTAPPPPAPAPVATNGTFNLGVLERLVAERGADHPERVEEWESYLFFLRDYAEPDGNLPHSFDFLVEETFRPLLA